MLSTVLPSNAASPSIAPCFTTPTVPMGCAAGHDRARHVPVSMATLRQGYTAVSEARMAPLLRPRGENTTSVPHAVFILYSSPTLSLAMRASPHRLGSLAPNLPESPPRSLGERCMLRPDASLPSLGVCFSISMPCSIHQPGGNRPPIAGRKGMRGDVRAHSRLLNRARSSARKSGHVDRAKGDDSRRRVTCLLRALHGCSRVRKRTSRVRYHVGAKLLMP